GQHAIHVAAGGLDIAAAEENRIILFDQCADGDAAGLRIDADDVADQIIRAVGATDRQADHEACSEFPQILQGFNVETVTENVIGRAVIQLENDVSIGCRDPVHAADLAAALRQAGQHRDRKSTRLNSSHVKISYAVFCLKKKS